MSLQTISESVYAGLCLKIGTPQQVAIRRETFDLEEILNNSVKLRQGMLSGSRREGFKLEGSDVDKMEWMNDHRVLWDFSQTQFYNTHRQAIILCDSSESPPGFTLLWLPLEKANDPRILSSCIIINQRLYISSSIFKMFILTFGVERFVPNIRINGPCHSITEGQTDFDNAQCLFSDFWPPTASQWIERCHAWPSPRVVESIVKSGCHFVAIGHKLGRHVDKEWRISFSQAEHKLVYSMNHTQFLTYGLLKLFLKEIINKEFGEKERLLCSYHMKTAVFWAIQKNTETDWSPQNLLAGFWVCYKLILKWVYEGVCPNFFIPENNMFLNNIYGVAQKQLFDRLYDLYEKGIALLLRSHTVRTFLVDGLCNPECSVCTDENAMISKLDLYLQLIKEIYSKNETVIANRKNGTDIVNLQKCIKYIHRVEQLVRSPLTQYQIVMLQKLTATIFQQFAFALNNTCSSVGRVNKQVYIADKLSLHMLKLAASFGFISDMLYCAMYFYKTFRVNEALSVIEEIKTKPWLVHNGHVNPKIFTDALLKQLFSDGSLNLAIAPDIKLFRGISYIDELKLEQRFCYPLRYVLRVPNLVMLCMIEFLCYKEMDTVKAQGVLQQFEDYLNFGDIVPKFKDISWEVLGICQQKAGNLQAALHSYQQSLRQEPWHNIQTATLQRIQELHLSSSLHT